jgi:hypothetical protein
MDTLKEIKKLPESELPFTAWRLKKNSLKIPELLLARQKAQLVGVAPDG